MQGEHEAVAELLRDHPEMDISKPVMLHDDDPAAADHGLTALHRAVVGGHVRVVRALLRAGASITALTAKKQTPEDLVRTAASGRRQIQRLLEAYRREDAEPPVSVSEGRDVVMAIRLANAVADESVERVIECLEAGAKSHVPVILERKPTEDNEWIMNDLTGETRPPLAAIHRAALSGNHRILEAILSRYEDKGAVAAKKDNYGNLPLDWLVMGTWNMLRILRTFGDDPAKPTLLQARSHVKSYRLLLDAVQDNASAKSATLKVVQSDWISMVLRLERPLNGVTATILNILIRHGRPGNLTKTLIRVCQDKHDAALSYNAGLIAVVRTLVYWGADVEALHAYIPVRSFQPITNSDFITLKVNRILSFPVGPPNSMSREEMVSFPVDTFPNGVPPHISRSVMRTAIIKPQSMLVEHRHKDLLRAFEPWTINTHKLMFPAHRQRIWTALLCSSRLAGPLYLPLELWHKILQHTPHLPQSSWPLGACGPAHAQ